jgi:hypothetical protein
MTGQKIIIAATAMGMLLILALGCQTSGGTEPAEQPPAPAATPGQAQPQGDRVEASADLQKAPEPAEATAEPTEATAKPTEATGAKTTPEVEPVKPLDPNAVSTKTNPVAPLDPKKTNPIAPLDPTAKKKEIPNRQRPRTVLSGCFTNPDARKGGGMRATPGAGPGQREGITVTKKDDTAIIIKHNITHNCCNKAKVNTKVMKHLVHVTEKLSGVSCRCKCSSTIKTIVPLAKGDYVVTVDLNQDGKVKKIHEAKISL